MDTTIMSTLGMAAGAGIAIVALISRSIGQLRSHMDQKIDAQGARIDGLRTELGARIDAQGTRIDGLRTELGGRIDALEAQAARTSDDVAFIKGRLTAQPEG